MVSPAEELRRDSQFDPERHDPMAGETVGDLLRRTREGYGQDIETVASQLRIRDSYLRAIEAGRFRELPGTTYAVGFVRTYAEYLRLDAQEILRRFREEVAEVNRQTQLIFPAATSEGKFPGGAILLLSVLLAGVAYGAWHYLSDQRTNVLDLIPAVPEQLMGLVSGDQARVDDAADPSTPEAAEPQAADSQASDPQAQGMAATREAETVEAQEGEATAEAESPPAETADEEAAAPDSPPAVDEAPGETAASGSEPQPGEGGSASATDGESAADGGDSGTGETTVAAIPAAPVVPTAEPDPQVFGAANTEYRVMLRARLESWVQVTDSADRILLTRVLRAGDSYRVPNQPGLTLATGNAGGLDIVVDGRTLPSLGPVGVVRRGIALDPEQLVDGAPQR